MENMKDISIGNRPNIGFDKMEDYENGGLCIESKEVNGVLLYVPYGIWCDIFDTMDYSVRLMENEIYQLEASIREMKQHSPEVAEPIISNHKEQIKKLQKQIDIFNNISPICQEV